MQILVVGTAIGETVDQPWVAMKVEYHRSVYSKQTIEVVIIQAVWMFTFGLSLKRSTTFTKRTFRSGNPSRIMAVAANASWVGMSPALANTTSGITPSSLLAHFQMPIPYVQ